MSVVTKTGDSGTTSLFNGERVKKTHPRIKALNSIQNLGYIIAQVLSLKHETKKEMYNFDDEIRTIQNWLFDLGAYIATAKQLPLKRATAKQLPLKRATAKQLPLKRATPLDSSTSEQVKRTEFTEDKEIYIHNRIKWIEKEIPKQTSFIIPNGNLFSIGLFRISGKVRTTEIDIIGIIENNKNTIKSALPFINRLSDYFYVLARYVNYHQKIISPSYKRNMKMKIGKDGNAIIFNIS